MPIDLTARYGEPPRTHLEWAENIARLIARANGLGARSADAADLVGVAHLTLVGLVPRFDDGMVPAGGSADGQFRGWAHRWVRTECRREARRLRNGGTYRTSDAAEARAVRVSGLPADARCPTCAEVMEAIDAEGAEEAGVEADHAPKLAVVRGSEVVYADGLTAAEARRRLNDGR